MTESVEARLLRLLDSSPLLTKIPGGKVREIYELTQHPNLLLMVVTDRWSARDFVFGFPIEGIAPIRNMMTIYWKLQFERQGIKTDLVAYGRQMDRYLPAMLQHNPELRRRGMLVLKSDMIKYEIILRLNAVGGIINAFNKGEAIFCGQQLPPNLTYGMEFNPPLPTPTTKAKKGHDEDVSYLKVEEEYPGLLAQAVGCGCCMRDVLLERRGW